MCGPRPAFLLSLPRSGSTLTQRLLAAHPEVATVSEPWALLPLLYAFRERGLYAEYAQVDYRRALDDLCRELPGGRDDWHAAVRDFAGSIYARLAGGAPVFLDKTPRYALVARELLAAFPEAPVVCLWRNPLAVVASIAETWDAGRWNLHYFRVDLYDGLARLVDAARDAPGRVHALRYEDLVREPEKHLRALFAHLGVSPDASVLEAFGDVALRGTMGDPVGARVYDRVSDAPLDKWKHTLASPLRKAWCRRYLRWIGRERLAFMGYDPERLRAELDALPDRPGPIASDAARMLWGVVYSGIELRQLRLKLETALGGGRVHAHR